jgi:hypothetical protein
MNRRRPNILFSTTVQWNAGDEFIYIGIARLLGKVWGAFNPVLYNRNPAVNPRYAPMFAWPRPPKILPENAFQPEDAGLIDYVIFAGTPEWAGGTRSAPLHRFILSEPVRCSFLGVGLASMGSLRGLATDVLKTQTDLFIARDEFAAHAAAPFIQPVRLPCPALLCSARERVRTGLNTIGCVVQNSNVQWHSIPTSVRDYLNDQYRRLREHYQVIFIAHYIDDLRLCNELGWDCAYSFSSRDYFEIYDACDLVVSPRVHGCGMAASLGIPSIAIPHDGRISTVSGFGATLAEVGDDLLELVRKANWTERSAAILDLKRQTWDAYCNALARVVPR